MVAYTPIQKRFYAKVRKSGQCHIWTGAVSTSGYGVIGLSRSNKTDYVHRLAYEWHVGPIPDKYQIDHLCMSRLCVNPYHLEAVTQAENLRRQNAVRWGGRTHCNQGHELTKWQKTLPSGRKYCRACHSERRRKKL